MQSFVCFGLKSQFGATAVTGFEDFVALDDWSGPPPSSIEVPEETRVDAMVYLIPSFPSEPDWASFIRQGLSTEVRIPGGSSPGALLLVRVKVRDIWHYFAFTFGTGRFLLRKDAYQRRFGLRVALNAVFEGDTAALTSTATRLKSVDAKRVSSKTIRMRHQATRNADFETFDVDRNRDFLRGVTGVPRKTSLWGRNITGADSLSVNLELSFKELPAFCKQLVKTYSAKNYKHRFGWIDDVGLLTDVDLLQRLEDTVLTKLKSNNLSALELSIPEIVEWDRIKSFVLPTQRRPRVEHLELRLRDYTNALVAKGMLSDLDAAMLRAHLIDVLDGAGDKWNSWSIWQCLTGEMQLEGRKFILDEGDFYEISSSFLSQLDADINKLVPQSTLVLPDANIRMTEEEYNRHAASSGFLLLDKRTVRVTRSTSQVEICDLLSQNRQFIHVKRKLGSSLLSHLFAQGYVSADLLQTSLDFRQVAGEMVRSVLSEPSSNGLNTTSFDLFDSEVSAPSIEVAYAIVADWQTNSLVERLPFFSKINLRRHASELRSRGFNVTHVRVQTHP